MKGRGGFLFDLQLLLTLYKPVWSSPQLNLPLHISARSLKRPSPTRKCYKIPSVWERRSLSLGCPPTPRLQACPGSGGKEQAAGRAIYSYTSRFLEVLSFRETCLDTPTPPPHQAGGLWEVHIKPLEKDLFCASGSGQ